MALVEGKNQAALKMSQLTAVIAGYDAMGFAMSKPHLRAGLETDLVKICDGQKSKGDVLRV